MPKTLHEIKREKFKKQNPNTITDSDYVLRDMEAEAKAGYPNTVDITPEEAREKPARKQKAASKED